MKVRYLLFGVLFALLTWSVNARADMTVLGAGLVSCQDWRDAQNTQKNDDILANWVLGYLSGAAMLLGEDKNVLKKIKPNMVILWFNNYCGNHPQTSVATAASSLFREIRAKTH